MVEDVVKEHFKKRENPYPTKSRKLLPLIIKKAVYPKIISMNDLDLIGHDFSMDISMKSIQMDELRIENKIWFEKLKNFNNDEKQQG
jgi:hypothetical protein